MSSKKPAKKSETFDDLRKKATVTLPQSPSGKAFEDLQKARTALRHMAHVYAGTKGKDKFFRDRAGEDLEKAAVTVTLAASLQGMWSDCAKPAGAVGTAWREGLEPENALAEAGKIVDKHLASSETTNLTQDLWWFIENVSDEDPTRTERFFALRERVRKQSGNTKTVSEKAR